MKSFLNNIASSFAGFVLFCVGCAMAGLGLSVVVMLALVALAAMGLALLASPFVAMSAPRDAASDADAAS